MLFTSKYKQHLYGWLSYAFASEVFVIVSLTLFLPICLEQFARDNGYLLPDKTVSCVLKVAAAPPVGAPEARCVVKLGWLWVDTASFSLYVYSIAVALQALTVISMGGIADHPPHRKRLLIFFALLGSISATLFLVLPSTSPIWPVAALLAMFANVGFGASIVAMNAYLPTLAKEDPEVLELSKQLADHQPRASHSQENDPDSSEPLLARAPSVPSTEDIQAQYDATLSATTARISSHGIAWGYIAGILLLFVALVPVTLLHGSTWALRLAIGLSGIWWAVGTIPAAMWLPSADSSDAEEWGTAEWRFGKEVLGAWIRLGNMLRWSEVRKLRNTFKYLAAWFLLSDGFTTITSTALLFAKTSLSMPSSSLILVGILTPSSGIIGSLVWPRIQKRLGWTNLKVLVLLVVLASLIPAYGCLGFLFEGRRSALGVEIKFGGLTTPGEMYGLAVVFGSVYGAFQGYARAFYAELIPPGEEARWYGLFSITDKSSSFLGPLVVGLIADITGNIRYAFFFLVIMIWAALPALLSVDLQSGRTDARKYRYRSSHM
ncbi:MFS general substrate transporter [Ephemerocybe angulata]|uniref:Autophagy-related protein n=1 Tax=Ephemerocybe angulata TaxID=980116 RepID=A0A8H6HLD1_9AGAR|nr:MFS general substrate transporter [Tulosesus angulatus]